MKKHYLFLVTALGLSTAAHSQTKIKDGSITSTNLPHAGAILELESDNKGLLLPRVSLTNTTIWGLSGTFVAGMSVYNTNAGITSSNASYPIITGGIGQYYFDGTGWVGTKPAAAGNFWGLTGNAGTDKSVNFLGTTDLQPLRFKANNVYSGGVGLELSGSKEDKNTTFGYGAGGDLYSSLSVGSVRFRKNTAIGYMALALSSPTGTQDFTENTVVGFEAGKSLTGSSNRNTLIGSVAGPGIGAGTYNTLVGQASMFFATGGDNNVMVGQGTGANQTGTISNNVYIGTLAGASATGSSNIFIGHRIGFTDPGSSNRLMIHNSDVSNPLIDGDMLARILTINNTLKVATSAAIGTTATPARTLHVVPAAGAATSLRIEGVPEHLDNAAAVTAGLVAGDVYRTGDVLKIVH